MYGSWELSQEGLLATADFDLSLDDLLLSGRINYVLDDMCWSKSFDSIAAVRQPYATVLEGSVEYCFGSGAASGRLQASVEGPAGSFDLLLAFDAGGGTALVVRDGWAAGWRAQVSLFPEMLGCGVAQVFRPHAR